MKLGRYEIVRELGKGAMGIVYLAKDPLIGRLVALKTIRVGANADDDETQEFRARFVREAQAAGILNHPSIVTVHDIGQDETGTSFIAMEYVEGYNLKEVLSQGRPLSFDQIGDIIAQVAEGLDFAHAKGIVHRDVKPANIILLEGNKAKITDFGIAKIASGGANLTTTGQFLGTPNYMAPEQIKGAPVDGRTDLFSLGICLYECLTRRKPFGGDSLTSISYKIVHEPFPPLQDANPQIPEGYEAVVAGCLAKEPARRYQRGRDLSNALRAVIRGEKPSTLTDVTSVEETIITRDRVPTLDVPFPESDSTNPGPAQAAVPLAAAGAGSIPTAPPGALPIADQVKKTLGGLASMSVLRRRITPPIFFGIIAVLVVLLLTGITLLRSGQPEIPAVDTAAESRRARETALRTEGNSLLRQGRVADAYVKFQELQRLAPQSAYVNDVMQKLGAIRQQEEVGRQQELDAQMRFDEGRALLDQRSYAEAIESFREALSLNPNFVAASEHLEFAESELQRVESARLASVRAQPTEQRAEEMPPDTRTARRGSSSPAGQSPDAPTHLTTLFSHPFTDGRLVVRAGSDIVADERLFEERPGRVLRRATRVAREINVTQHFPAKSTDLHIWVTVPGENIQEHHVVPAVRFSAGVTHRLTVHYDPSSKRFSYDLQ